MINPHIAGKSSEDVLIALDCLDLTMTKRRKQVSHPRLLGFIKRLTSVALQFEAHTTLAALAMTKNLLHVSASLVKILWSCGQWSSMLM